MVKNNLELIKFALSIVGHPYVYGVNGKVITEHLIQIKAKQYPKLYTSKYIAKARTKIGQIAYDCSGMIDVFLEVDFSADSYYEKAIKKGNKMTEMPDLLGVLVHFTGHIGVYIGNGKVVEARGIDYGVIITNLKDRPWVRWSICPLINYITEPIKPIEKPKNPYKFPEITLYLGNKKMTKENIKWLQFELNKKYKTKIDGLFGTQTDKDLKQFQSEVFKSNLVDGKCGPLTKEKLLKQ